MQRNESCSSGEVTVLFEKNLGDSMPVNVPPQRCACLLYSGFMAVAESAAWLAMEEAVIFGENSKSHRFALGQIWGF